MGTLSDVELLARSLKNPARLCLAPTTTSGSFPYSGTSLGFARATRLRYDVIYDRRYDPTTRQLREVGRIGVENVALLGILDGYDEDLIAAIYTKTTAAASLAVPYPPEVRIEGATVPAVVPAIAAVLFASIDPRQKSVYFRRPVVTIDMADPITQYALRRNAGLPFVIEPTPPSGKKPWQIARLENLTLEAS